MLIAVLALVAGVIFVLGLSVFIDFTLKGLIVLSELTNNLMRRWKLWITLVAANVIAVILAVAL